MEPEVTHKCPPPVPILSQLHPVCTTPSNFLKIHLDITLPSMSGSPQWSLSLKFPHQHPVHTSLLPIKIFRYRVTTAITDGVNLKEQICGENQLKVQCSEVG
jgi:hypothetical protein